VSVCELFRVLEWGADVVLLGWMSMTMLALDGFAIGVTADRRAEEQCEMLRRRGARVVVGPAVRTLPLAKEAGVREITEALVAAAPDVLVANTGIGIRSWFAAAESWGLGAALVDALRGARIVARGPKAAGAVLTAGLSVAWRARSETLVETIDEVLTGLTPGERVAVQLDGNVEQPEVQRLRAAGAEVVEVRVYEWTQPGDLQPALRLVDAACARQLDAVTFTSAAAVHNLFALAAIEGYAEALRDAFNDSVLAMSVGPVCAGAVTEHGARGTQPERPRLGAMVHALTSELGMRRRWFQLAGTAVVVQGTTLTVDGQRVSLSDRERSVLELLIARGGAVVSKNEMMHAVWGANVDDHVLEVAVGRLRRRLGPAGTAIRTVVRRGYRLEADGGDEHSN
jgi:uroporphyrinogen-III synthase